MSGFVIPALIHIIKNVKDGYFSGMVGSICRLMTGVVLVIGDMCHVMLCYVGGCWKNGW